MGEHGAQGVRAALRIADGLDDVPAPALEVDDFDGLGLGR
jgi:hypothetical protein